MQKILYVEDNDDNVYVMKGRLPRLEFEVVVAADGEQGVAMAETEAPDLILMDLRLPGIDGWETNRRVTLPDRIVLGPGPPTVIASRRWTGQSRLVRRVASGGEAQRRSSMERRRFLRGLARGIAGGALLGDSVTAWAQDPTLPTSGRAPRYTRELPAASVPGV